MRGLLNILIAFLVIVVIFNYQFYYIRKSINFFNNELDAIKDFSNLYDIGQIEEYYKKSQNDEYDIEEYYIQYDDYIPDDNDIIDEKIAVINFEKSEIDSLSEIKCTSLRTTNFYLLKDLTAVRKDKSIKQKLTDNVKYELYIVESNKSLIIIAGNIGLTTSELESGRFIISGTKQSLSENVYKQINKDCKKLYPDDYRRVKNVYILLEKSN